LRGIADNNERRNHERNINESLPSDLEYKLCWRKLLARTARRKEARKTKNVSALTRLLSCHGFFEVLRNAYVARRVSKLFKRQEMKSVPSTKQSAKHGRIW